MGERDKRNASTETFPRSNQERRRTESRCAVALLCQIDMEIRDLYLPKITRKTQTCQLLTEQEACTYKMSPERLQSTC